MLSLKEFEQFETVCRVVRGNNSFFGGIQVLLCGDFYQLSPVGNELYNDSGRFCFESEVFKESITHRVDLKKVVRQEEHLLIKAVRETALGSISPEVDTFLKSLQRPVPEDVKPVHLFAKNIDSTLYNNDCLTKHVGEERVYRATKNSGSEKYLRKILAPNYLQMKIGCPVILLLNLGGKLVNGLSGSVKKLDENVIHVHFNAIKETHSIRRHLFSKYSTKENRNIAEREQFPLMLGYGITIHKAQGMTLENVFVHCKGIFQAGQLSVGIGRAVTSVGLFLSDYRKGLCPQPKAAISQFYGKESKPLLDDFTCCSKISIHVANNIECDGDHCVDSDGSDLDSEGQEDIDDEFQMPPYIKPEELKLIAYTKDPMTITQKTINDICLNMDEAKLRKFVSLQYKRIKTALPDEMSLKSTSTKNWTSIFSNQHQYLESQQYRTDLQIVFGTLINDDHSHIGSDIVFGILKSVIENLAEQVTTEPSQMTSFKRGPITDAGKAKVRNVAGMCIFKVRNHYVNIILSNIGNPDPKVREHVKIAQGRVEILNKMIADIDSYDLEHDKSLEDIERRQNVRKSLTCVSDKTFQFFLLLNFNVHQVLNMSTLQKEKENVFESAKIYLEGNEDLHMIFFELFENTDDSDTIFDLYKAIIYKYLMVCHKQLIKDTKDNLNIEKKKAHREEITKKKRKKKNGSKFNNERYSK